jgi:hypothetical protein
MEADVVASRVDDNRRHSEQADDGRLWAEKGLTFVESVAELIRLPRVGGRVKVICPAKTFFDPGSHP